MTTDICPFCLHQPMGVQSDRDQDLPTYRVVCVCGAVGSLGLSPTDAVAKWNAWRQSGQNREIETAADLLRTIFLGVSAAKTIRLKGMPDSCDAANGLALAEELHSTLALNMMEDAHGQQVDSSTGDSNASL